MPATVPRLSGLPRLRPPALLAIVFGVFLAIVGITATAQSLMVSLSFSTSAINSTVGNDSATIQTWANTFLRPSDLASTVSLDRHQTLDGQLAVIADRSKLARIEIRDLSGQVLLSSDRSAVGSRATDSAEVREAEQGRVAARFVPANQSGATGTFAAPENTLREYLPLLDRDGKTAAVVAIWRDAAPILAEIDRVRRDVIVVTLTAAIVACALLYLIFRSAQRRIARQTAQLLESTHRDPLTGTLNHGALVSELGAAIEAGHREAKPIAVALIDIDGFRLLNDTYGHAAADFALCELARLVTASLPGGAIYGRYGPDEFLVIDRGGTESEVESCLETVRAALGNTALEFETGQRVPLTISAGIAGFPADARSVTELLSVTAVTLAAARASGGDSIRLAGSIKTSAADRTFGVLQGLVIAVDTKDHYTKRHSEDVARYSVFLARQLGLDDELLSAIRIAGLLHDIGKIGIPDAILRKPGRLTAAEYEVVKHHVALGDMIVHGLPNIDLIRDGVRYHHERWDGCGYPAGLAHEDVPLIARILAIADAFSTMTTTRPYRKAFSVKTSLRRLEDAAGSQLDERLVRVFVAGIESVPDAPQPDLDAAVSIRIWTPTTEFAS